MHRHSRQPSRNQDVGVISFHHGAELGGIIGLESAAYAPGRANQFLHHPAVHGGEMAATYSFGLTAPQSPEECRRENWWYYSQSGPGVYLGDIHFYSSDWDAREELGAIDTDRCPVVLLTGEYDYSCTPDNPRVQALHGRASRGDRGPLRNAQRDGSRSGAVRRLQHGRERGADGHGEHAA